MQNYVHDDVNPVITTEDYRLVPSDTDLRRGLFGTELFLVSV